MAVRQQRLWLCCGCTLPHFHSCSAACTHALRRHVCWLGLLLQVPTAVRADLEQLLHCSLVKEAQTIAKYRVPAVEATLAALEEARDGAKLCVLRFLAEVGRPGWGVLHVCKVGGSLEAIDAFTA